MSNPCYYHPQSAAVGACVQCGTPGCADCLEAVGERMACRRCAGALKGRLAAAAAPGGPSPVSPSPAAGFNPNAGLNFASAPADFVDTTPPAKLTPDRLLMGLGLASAVGLLGSLGIEKILFYSHFGFPFLYLILGAAVAGSLRAFTGRGGQAMALTAAAVMAVCLGVGHLVYVQDFLSRARAVGDAGAGTTFSDALPVALGGLNFTHWIMALGSVMLCLLMANRPSRPGF